MKLSSYVVMFGVMAGTANAAVVDFELGGPDFFIDAQALTNEYAALGVVFSGPSALNGGAVLNDSGGFGVNARSGTDFLAFNVLARFRGGGVPIGPETLTFAGDQTFVEIYASGGDSVNLLRMDAFNAGGELVATSGTVNAPNGDWAAMSVTGVGIRSVVLSQVTGDGIYLFDDLTFVPAPGAAALLGVATLAVVRRRRT